MTQRYAPWPFDPEVPELREYDPALWVMQLPDGMLRFKADRDFEVDGIEYDAWSIEHVIRPIVSLIRDHRCTGDEQDCEFDETADRSVARMMTISKAYRWRPGLVYYQATEFSTPIHGG